MKRLTKAQRQRLVPFLPQLIDHWERQVQWFDGRTMHPGSCPLCDADDAAAGWEPHCTRCPVWGRLAKSRGPCVCLDYMPSGFTRHKSVAQRILRYLQRLEERSTCTA